MPMHREVKALNLMVLKYSLFHAGQIIHCDKLSSSLGKHSLMPGKRQKYNEICLIAKKHLIKVLVKVSIENAFDQSRTCKTISTRKYTITIPYILKISNGDTTGI